MAQDASSAQQASVRYFSALWQNVIKLFFIDLAVAATILFATCMLALALFAAAHHLWGLKFRSFSESLLILAAVYLAVTFLTAIRRHVSLGKAFTAQVHPSVDKRKAAPTIDNAGISTTVS